MIERLLPQSGISFAHFRGNDITEELIDKKQIVGNLPELVEQALVNALVHRNYSIIGSKIRVLMFSDRIEFHSPSKLPNTVTIDKMKIGVSYSRNPFLVKYKVY